MTKALILFNSINPLLQKYEVPPIQSIEGVFDFIQFEKHLLKKNI